jgi:hypothetical protein
MKRIQSFVTGLLACGIVFAMATTLTAQSVQQGSAKVVNIKGSARYMSGDTSWHPLKVGAVLKPGSIIQTASGSYVDLVLNNEHARESASANISTESAPPAMNASFKAQPVVEQDAVRVFENTVLGIDKLNITQTGADRVTDTTLDLKAGKILGTVKKLSAASSYEVKIPNGIAGIRGTIYLITATGEVSVLSSLSDLANQVPSGSVVMAYKDADGNVITQVVGNGQHFDTSTGQLTPLPQSAVDDMTDVARQLGIGPTAPVVLFVQDHTVYYVSPTSGQSQTGGQQQPPAPINQGGKAAAVGSTHAIPVALAH